ncbi:kinase-like domain-containing protein [Fimicolochytrium jonesii]|uniref:kinase-like domain-containing protein n=1 Tax=Fimicolochytrium jonesii TaxID=1396493 RepID=UPI0022FF1EF1|nr:kinase-like domain-containing protein [Fimicolochytrium jonesii]KAI8821866.1 kinase-like domain-containing protein [Fimicolochytrium jonesii]
MPFLQMENINRFLTAAQTLGLKGHEIFQTVDLFEGKEMQSVITTILTIARVIAGAPLKARPPDDLNPYRDNVIIHDASPLPTNQASPSIAPTLPPKSPPTHAPFLQIKSASASSFTTPPPASESGTEKGGNSGRSSMDSRGGASPTPVKSSGAPRLKKSESELGMKVSRRRTESPHRSARPSTSGSVRSMKEKTVVGNYQLGSGIGKGQFGAVYQALNMETGQVAAIKRIPLADRKEQGVTDLMQEVELLKSLTHTNIVKYLGFLLDENYLNIILEYMECGSLQSVMKKYNLLIPEKLAAVYSEDILRGLTYLHAQGVVHCDLKCANILTTKDSTVKLSDFGVSKVLNGVGEDEGAIAGTPYWMAPEIIELKGASTASDIWSLGCTIIEMVTGKPPYLDLKNPMTALFRIVEDDAPPLPEDISQELRDFFGCCFQRDITKRASASQLLQHEWIQKKYKDVRTAEESLKLLEVGAQLIQENAKDHPPPTITSPSESSTHSASAGSTATPSSPSSASSLPPARLFEAVLDAPLSTIPTDTIPSTSSRSSLSDTSSAASWRPPPGPSPALARVATLDRHAKQLSVKEEVQEEYDEEQTGSAVDKSAGSVGAADREATPGVGSQTLSTLDGTTAANTPGEPSLTTLTRSSSRVLNEIGLQQMEETANALAADIDDNTPAAAASQSQRTQQQQQQSNAPPTPPSTQSKRSSLKSKSKEQLKDPAADEDEETAPVPTQELAVKPLKARFITPPSISTDTHHLPKAPPPATAPPTIAPSLPTTTTTASKSSKPPPPTSAKRRASSASSPKEEKEKDKGLGTNTSAAALHSFLLKSKRKSFAGSSSSGKERERERERERDGREGQGDKDCLIM